MKLKRVTLSPSMIVALIALFVALSGAAYAGVTLSNNTVRSNHIVNGQVKTADIKNGDVRNIDLRNNSVNSAKIANGTVGIADLSAAASADLNDAATVGGLTVAQIVAAAGGQYFEARQAAGSVNINGNFPATTLVTLSLPAAGKYLVTARMPVRCTWDGTGATAADGAPNAAALAPYVDSILTMSVAGTSTDTVSETCEVEAENEPFIFGSSVFYGTRTVTVSRQIEIAGATDITIAGSSDFDSLLGQVRDRLNATSAGSMIQAITVRT